MARNYPRFLFSNPQNTKSKGPFIVHLLEPRFICKFYRDGEDLNGSTSHYINTGGWSLELLDDFGNSSDEKRKIVGHIMYDMLSWLTSQVNSKAVKL